MHIVKIGKEAKIKNAQFLIYACKIDFDKIVWKKNH